MALTTKEEIMALLSRHKKEMSARFSVKRIGLFGSYLHGETDEYSDVDILVEMQQPTFDKYMDLKFFLEEQLGRPVDLVLAETLKPRLKPIIAKEVTYA